MMQPKSTDAEYIACDYDERKYHPHPLYLKPHTLLKNQYVINKALGQGGFGITYTGFDRWLQKKVAIKEFLPSALATRDFQTANIVPIKKQENAFYQGLQLFIDEARNLAKFDHPHIVHVINFFEDNQTAYIVMEHLEGENLTELLTRLDCHLTVEESLAIMFPILDALAEVHAQHIYHRDISPQNIRILSTGIPVLIDFGAARHVVGENSRSLDLVLKHGYSPLEQYSGKGKIGAWTDIYASGALLYLLMSGILPPAATDRFCDDTLIPLAEQPDLSISNTISNAVMTALAVRLEERFQNVSDFKAALEGRQSVTLLIPPHRGESVRYPIATTVIASIVTLTISTLILANFIKPPVTNLLEKAKIQWITDKIITPPGDNVYETYQQILTIDPHNYEAKQGINEIALRYVRLAQEEQIAGRFVEGLQFVAQGLQIANSHEALLALQRALQAQQMQQQLRTSQIDQLLTQATQYVQSEQLEAAYRTYRQILLLAPDNSVALTQLPQLITEYVKLINEQAEESPQRIILLNQALSLFPESQSLKDLQQQRVMTQSSQEIIEQDNIKQLLAKAEQQITTLRLTEPSGNNAYETYQHILTIMPNHSKAKLGLTKIADIYEKLAINEANNMEKSLTLIEKGLKVSSKHAGLLNLQRNIIEKKNKINRTEQSVPTIEVPEIEVAATPIQPVIPLEKTTLQELLIVAEQQLESGQFEAAYHLYHNVLQLDVRNQQAKNSLQQIARHYEQLAKQQREKGDLTGSLTTVEKGLTLYPNQSGLLTLQKEVHDSLNAKTQPHNEPEKDTPPKQSTPSNILFTPSF